MSTINFEQLTSSMLNAAEGILKKQWTETKPYAETAFKAFAQNIEKIAEMQLLGKINEEQAKIYIEMQKSAMKVIMLTVEGMSILAAEEAINAALDIVRNTVNTALRWSVI